MFRLQNKEELASELERIHKEESSVAKLVGKLLSRPVSAKLLVKGLTPTSFDYWYFVSVNGEGERGVSLEEIVPIASRHSWLANLFKFQQVLLASEAAPSLKFKPPPKWRNEAETERYLISSHTGERWGVSLCRPI